MEITAQDLIIVDPSMVQPMAGDMSLVPLEVSEESHPMEMNSPGEIEIVIEELPGAPTGTRDPEPILEVIEDSKEENKDDNDAKSKKNDKWDWASKGAEGFVTWIKERINDVPKHSGQDSSGLERAMSYLERLDNEISKAMRLDLDGQLDANKIEEVRSKIDDGLARLNSRLDKVRKHTKSKRKKKSDFEPELVKEAQKINGVKGVFVTVPLLISGIARVCINGMVSGGHDIEYIYKEQVKKFNLNEREKAEVRWALFDMGYGMRGDRGFMPDEDVDYSSSDNFDYAANYQDFSNEGSKNV